VNNRSEIEVLRRRIDFEEVRKRGRRSHPAPWLILNQWIRIDGQRRYGFVIPKKVGSAVLRNRIRRILRESLKRTFSKEGIPSQDVVFVVKPGFIDRLKKLNGSDVQKILEKIFERR